MDTISLGVTLLFTIYLPFQRGPIPVGDNGNPRMVTWVDWLARDRETELSSMEFSLYITPLKCVKCTLEKCE